MSQYILRLDDACEKRDINKWDRIESLIDSYDVKPLVGVIPLCKDPKMDKYKTDNYFWGRVKEWENKGWTIALHGCTHVYSSNKGGINPVNNVSEFAGEPYAVQRKKICDGLKVFEEHGIDTRVFFAPSHTFDLTTISVLLEETHIRIISDTIADRPYQKYGITFVPQQSGSVRYLPLHTVTFCYHPNTMDDTTFDRLDDFLKKNSNDFISFPMNETTRKMSLYDKILRKAYFARRK